MTIELKVAPLGDKHCFLLATVKLYIPPKMTAECPNLFDKKSRKWDKTDGSNSSVLYAIFKDDKVEFYKLIKSHVFQNLTLLYKYLPHRILTL